MLKCVLNFLIYEETVKVKILGYFRGYYNTENHYFADFFSMCISPLILKWKGKDVYQHDNMPLLQFILKNVCLELTQAS